MKGPHSHRKSKKNRYSSWTSSKSISTVNSRKYGSQETREIQARTCWIIAIERWNSNRQSNMHSIFLVPWNSKTNKKTITIPRALTVLTYQITDRIRVMRPTSPKTKTFRTSKFARYRLIQIWRKIDNETTSCETWKTKKWSSIWFNKIKCPAVKASNSRRSIRYLKTSSLASQFLTAAFMATFSLTLSKAS